MSLFFADLNTFQHTNKISEDTRAKIQRWLAGPDPFFNLRRSLKSRTADTGNWYLQGAQYASWKEGGPPFAWLYGSPGSGKTYLSAGIIQNLQQYCDMDPARSLAFFFFDFNDAEKQKPVNMLKSLLSQLLSKCTRVPDRVRELYAACDQSGRQASEDELLGAVNDTVGHLSATFVVLDALDECSDRDGLFETLQEMHGWGNHSLRVLSTSRKEVDIEEALEDLVPRKSRTCLESRLVDKDIQAYVHERLVKDKSFGGWRRVQKSKNKNILEDIEKTLGQKANGMYSAPHTSTSQLLRY